MEGVYIIYHRKRILEVRTQIDDLDGYNSKYKICKKTNA